VLADRDAVQDATPGTHPYVIADPDTSGGYALAVRGIIVVTRSVIRRNDGAMGRNAYSLADMGTAVAIDDREWVDAAMITDLDFATVGHEHRKSVDLTMCTYVDRTSPIGTQHTAPGDPRRWMNLNGPAYKTHPVPERSHSGLQQSYKFVHLRLKLLQGSPSRGGVCCSHLRHP
jgi:hypothetical protein